MLVLSRKTEESVVVGGAGGLDRVLTVKVLDIRGGRVRLGFEADAEVSVHRSEVWERIRANGNGNGRAAALTEGPAARVA